MQNISLHDKRVGPPICLLSFKCVHILTSRSFWKLRLASSTRCAILVREDVQLFWTSQWSTLGTAIDTMESYTFFFIANAFLLSSHGVSSAGPKTCDPTYLDDESCGVHCNSLWGRAPLFNIPWSRGIFHKGNCVCRFNNEKLHSFTAHECIQKSIWSSFRSKKKIAEQGINAKVISMNFRQRFEVFKGAYKKKYGSQAEESKRFAIFKDNLAIIDGLMARRTGNVVFGVGPFTDLTRFEYRAMRGNIKRKSSSTKRLQPRMLRRLSQSRRPEPLGPSGRKGRSLSFGSAADLSRTDSFGSARRSRSVPPPPRSPFPVESRPKPFIGRDPEGSPLVDWRVPANLYPSTEPQVRDGFYIRYADRRPPAKMSTSRKSTFFGLRLQCLELKSPLRKFYK
ncbi:unnamed protein product [Bemisia tabaci]|uniref:Cathepsin propeptide inhibitor domain-containing protein n=1 Tax=Bemisia tabaci TaxID=7038 RepID=A0A9P0F9W0_BEMTA|nr:unnamed protein product [Bemisia tabaci]